MERGYIMPAAVLGLFLCAADAGLMGTLQIEDGSRMGPRCRLSSEILMEIPAQDPIFLPDQMTRSPHVTGTANV